MTLSHAVLCGGDSFFDCWFIEREWNGNMPNSSCIPEGIYIAKRISTSSKTNGNDTFEIIDVEGRTHIQIHPANFSRQLLGCLAPGGEPCVIGSEFGVPRSRSTFIELMNAIGDQEEITVYIKKA